MRILLLGKNGQVGWELQRALQPIGELISLGRETEKKLSGDVTDFDGIRHLFEELKPDIVVNATAYTAVDKAEELLENNELINHLAVKNLANLCSEFSSLFIHYSTDYVFDGSGHKPWSESDTPSPINQYGVSKRNGERAIEYSGCRFINFRTSWVYGVHGNNFIKSMLKLFKMKESLNIVSDQIGAPTGAALIADVTAHSIRHYLAQSESQQDKLSGHYHFAAGGETSWYDYAQYIFEFLNKFEYPLEIKEIRPISTAEYPTPASRPLNSRLNTNKLKSNFDLYIPDWKIGVRQVLQELVNEQ